MRALGTIRGARATNAVALLAHSERWALRRRSRSSVRPRAALRLYISRPHGGGPTRWAVSSTEAGDGCGSRLCSLNHRPGQFLRNQLAMALALESGERLLIAWPRALSAREVEVQPTQSTLDAATTARISRMRTIKAAKTRHRMRTIEGRRRRH